MQPALSAGNAPGKSRLVLVLLLIGGESGARFFSQSQTVAMQNQSNCVITFDTQMKTALIINNNLLISNAPFNVKMIKSTVHSTKTVHSLRHSTETAPKFQIRNRN